MLQSERNIHSVYYFFSSIRNFWRELFLLEIMDNFIQRADHTFHSSENYVKNLRKQTDYYITQKISYI